MSGDTANEAPRSHPGNNDADDGVAQYGIQKTLSIGKRGSHLVSGDTVTEPPRSSPGSGKAEDEVVQDRIQRNISVGKRVSQEA